MHRDQAMGFEGIREEHRAAERLLGELEGQDPTPAEIADLVALLTRHFRTDEEELVPFLSDHLPSSTGPIPVILEEHGAIRSILAELEERPTREALARLDGLLRSHIAKEEELLLPFAEARLTPPPAFDSLADLYDLLVDWEKRLPREVGFLARRFESHGVRTVLDAACGTGTHLAALAARGYDVVGADVAPEMVEQARRRCGPGVPIFATDFARVHEHVEPRDAVVVIGNSLPNAGTEAGVREALEGLARAVRSGGLLLLHQLNYPKLVREGGGAKPPRRVVSNGKEHVFRKVFDVRQEAVRLTVIAESEGSERRTESTLWPVDLPWLEPALAALGLEIIEATDGFSDEPYDEETSGDLLVVAAKKERRP
ncbi:MAG: methyltransferase domain-containing protein [Planctomycetota bacterium]|jgi:SAM-dependent methyltransferase